MCRSITFHTNRQDAQAHLDNHPELHAVIVGQTDAIALADYAFGPMLASTEPPKKARPPHNQGKSAGTIALVQERPLGL
jgi:hypothetical protein